MGLQRLNMLPGVYSLHVSGGVEEEFLEHLKVR